MNLNLLQRWIYEHVWLLFCSCSAVLLRIGQLIFEYWCFGKPWTCQRHNINRTDEEVCVKRHDRSYSQHVHGPRFRISRRERHQSIYWSVVCNVRAPYAGDWNFRQCFTPCGTLAMRDFWINILRSSSQGNPFVGGRGLNPGGVAKYSDFEPFEGYISETMHDIIYVCINH